MCRGNFQEYLYMLHYHGKPHLASIRLHLKRKYMQDFMSDKIHTCRIDFHNLKVGIVDACKLFSLCKLKDFSDI